LPPLSPSAWLVCTRKLSAIEDSRTLIAPAHVTVGTVTAANSAVSNASTRSSRVDKGCGASQNAISGRKAHRPQPLVGGCPRPGPNPARPRPDSQSNRTKARRDAADSGLETPTSTRRAVRRFSSLRLLAQAMDAVARQDLRLRNKPVLGVVKEVGLVIEPPELQRPKAPPEVKGGNPRREATVICS